MAKTVPLIPFPRGTVLLPGVVYRLSAPATRPDIPALVAAVCHQMATGPDGGAGGAGAVPVVCVPHRSPLIGPDGQLLIQDGSETSTAVLEEQPPPAGVVDKAEFFGYGTAARIVAFGGGAAGELSVVVEGTGRVKMGKVSEETPYFKGQVEFVTEEIPLQDTQLRDLFTLLKARSVELIAAHVSSLISNPPYASSHPLHVANVRRIGLIVRGAQLKDSGSLADLMASVIGSTYEEKLQVLATLDVKTRVVKVIELLERQVDELKPLIKAAALAALQARMVDGWSSRGRRPRRRPAPLPPADGSHNNPFLPPARPSSSSGPQFSWDDNGAAEPNELEELRTRLEAAQLPPDAAKMAARELRRLQKMAPANQEYQVVRNWLETLSEIPWSAVTHDRLDQTTLTGARRQLDDDHYGLEPVKKRLIEYLAVLRLKQSVNDDVDAQIGQLQRQMAAAGTGGADGDQFAADRSSSSPEQGAAAAATTTEETTTVPTAVNESSSSRSSIQQVLESLRARRISADGSPPIMLLVGPPGVGKTSLAKSVAAALGRKFHRICLGGIRDEAEIRGHRRTYVAAMPGILVQALRKVAVANPVILLDEIDKLSGSSHHGDPSAAMLEVLDPEQNRGFTDHYVGTPVDLSRVLFIATANDPDAIPAPLLDRMETIAIPGYTTLEKRHIALQHLVPRQVAAHGLGPGQIQFDTAVVSVIIESYTREAGVRGLEREIAAMCRAKAVELAEARDAGRPETYRSQLTVEDVGRILGDARFEDEILDAAAEGATTGDRGSGISSRPGVVTGLVAYSRGGTGSILFIEIADMPGDGKVQLTGQLGSVLQESVSVALSWVKAHAFDIGLTQDPTVNIMQDRSIHVHCPAGAVPKDGPSSGIAQAIALISLFAAKPVPPTMAMTGEISLRGRITAVGGIKEKMIGALRAGVKTVLLPAQNRNDVRDLPQEVKDGIEIYPVSHIWEAIRLVWPDWRQDTSPHQSYSGIESQL